MNILNIIEIIWTLVTFTGFVLNFYALTLAQGDLRALKESGQNGARKIVAKANVRQEIIRTIKQATFAVLGVWAVLIPNPVRQEVSIFGLVLSIVLTALACLLVAGSYLDWRDRQRVLKEIDNELAEAERKGTQECTDTSLLQPL